MRLLLSSYTKRLRELYWLPLIMAGGMLAQSNVNWTAGSGTDFQWSNGANWDVGEPDGTSDVFFPAAIPNPGSQPAPETILLSDEIAQSLTFDGTGYILSGGSLELTGAGNITVAPGASATIDSILDGSSGLTKLGDGTLTLGGNGANTYSGLTQINAGTLILNKSASTQAIGGDIIVNGGTLQWGSSSHQIADTASLTLASGSINFQGRNETFQNFTKTGGDIASGASGIIAILGTLQVSGGTSNGNGAFGYTVNSGSTSSSLTSARTVDFRGYSGTALQIGANSATNTATLSVGEGGLWLDGQSLQLNVSTASNAKGSRILLGGTLTATGNNVVRMNAGANASASAVYHLDLDGGTREFDIQSGTTFINESSGENNKLIVITNGGLVKTGAGTLQFNGTEANSYTGLTTINEGILRLSKDAGVASVVGDILINEGGTLSFGTANQLGAATSITVDGGTVDSVSRDQTFANYTQITGGLTASGNTGDVTITGSLELLGGNTLTLNSNSGGAATDWSADRVVLTGAGILLGGNSGTGNPRTTFTVGAGGLEIAGQTIVLYRGSSGTQLNILGDVTSSGNSRIDAQLSGDVDPLVNLGAATRTFNVQDGLLDIYASIIGDAGAGIRKTGSGMLSVLVNNTYDGATVVEAGSLWVTGTSGRLTNTSSVSVNGGGVLQIGSSVAASNNGVTNRINSLASVTLGGSTGGGVLTLAAAEVGSNHDQSFTDLNISGGQNIINTNADTGTNSLTFTGIYNRVPDGWVNFDLQNGFTVSLASDPTSNGSSVHGSGPNAVLAGAILDENDFIAAQSGILSAAVYTDTGTNTWTSGANMNVTGSNPTAYSSTTINTLRFGDAASHTVLLDGTHTISSGMILVSEDVAANTSTITGGQIQAGAGETLAIYQNNILGSLEIASEVISSNGLVKMGDGILLLSGNNTYSGVTQVLSGVLQAQDGTGLSSSSNLTLNGGVYAPVEAVFDRALGDDAGEVQLTGGASGFTAIGGSKAIAFGGNTDVVEWGSEFFNPDVFVLNDVNATDSLEFQNGLDLAGGDRTVFVGASTATITGMIENSINTSDFIKTGAGTLVLSNANTYNGSTRVQAGTLGIGNNNALGTSVLYLTGGGLSAVDGPKVISNNVIQQANTTISGSNNLTLTGSYTVAAGTKDITNDITSGAIFEMAGNVYLSDSDAVSSNLRFFGGGTTVISGVIANNSGANTTASHIFFNGSGLLRLTADNTFTGSVLAAGSGAISLSKDSNLGAAPTSPYEDSIILAAGGRLLITESFELNSNRHIGIGNSGGGSTTGILDVNSGVTFTVGSVIDDREFNQDGTGTPANVGSLRKSGSGTLILKGENEYSGETFVSGGLLRIENNNALGDTVGGTSVSSGMVLQLADGIQIVDEVLNLAGTGQSFGEVSNLGALQAGIGATASWDGDIILAAGGARVGAQENGKLIINGIIQGSATRFDISASINNGRVVLNAQNTYGDGTTATVTNIVRGLTVLGVDNALPTYGTLDVHFASSNNSEYAGVDMNGFDQTVGALINTGNTNTNAEVTNRSYVASTFTVDQDIDTTYGGILTGNLSLVKKGSGVLTLTRTNTYTGDTVIDEGTLRLDSSTAIPDGFTKGNVVLNGSGASAGTLDVNNRDETINGLNGSAGSVNGRVVNNSATATTRTLRLGAGGADGDFAGQILNNSGGGALGTLALSKIGRGTQILSGANGFTGGVTAYNGRLSFDFSNQDSLNSNAIRLAGGTVHFKAAASGTTESLGNITITQSTLNTVVTESPTAASSWETSGLSTTSGAGGAQGFFLLDRSNGGNLKTTAALGTIDATSTNTIKLSSAGIAMSVTGAGSGNWRATAFVKDANGTGFMTQNASNELVRYTGYTTADNLANVTTSSSTGNYIMTGDVSRSSALNFSTLLIEATNTADPTLTLDMGGANILSSASVGRSILVTGTQDVLLTGTGSIANSIYITSFNEGKTTIDMALGAGVAMVTGGTGFMEYTKTLPADLYVLGNLMRLTGEQDYSSSGVLRMSNGGVLEIGADLATTDATADFTRLIGTTAATRIYGDGGFSAYTAAPGGTRVVRLGTVTAGDGGTLTWGAGGFLVSSDSTPVDVDGVFKLSSEESNATLEFQNSINLNNRVRTVDVADGSAEVDARLTGVLSHASGGLNKVGEGTLEVTGENTYGGETHIQQGVFLASNTAGSATGSGSVKIYNGATLGGTGTVGSGAASSTSHIVFDAGSKLMVGSSHGSSSGAASQLVLQTAGTGMLVLGGDIQMDIFANSNDGGLNPVSSNDVLVLESDQTVQLSGTFTVENLSPESDPVTWMLNSAWQLIDWSGVTATERYAGQFDTIILPDLDAALGYTWDISQLYTTGIITIVPEPGKGLLLTLAAGMFVFRRRRK